MPSVRYSAEADGRPYQRACRLTTKTRPSGLMKQPINDQTILVNAVWPQADVRAMRPGACVIEESSGYAAHFLPRLA